MLACSGAASSGDAARGPALSVASYDRLFPSEPRRASQRRLRKPHRASLATRGSQTWHTEFLDEELEPHRDQWSFLASVPKIAPDRLAELIADSGADRALALRAATERPELPWRPSRTLADRLRGTLMPDRVKATLAERLYIDRTGLPPVLVDATRRLATFPNPMFMELQAWGLSVARTPTSDCLLRGAGSTPRASTWLPGRSAGTARGARRRN